MKQFIYEQHADTSILISELSRLPRGEIATYADHFSRWLGRKICGRNDMPTFATVETRLRADYSMTLSVMRGVGYVVLSHTENLKNEVQTNRIRCAAQRRKKELQTIDTGSLGEHERLDYVCKLTQAHLIEEAGKERTLKKLSAAANGTATPISLEHALEALKNSIK